MKRVIAIMKTICSDFHLIIQIKKLIIYFDMQWINMIYVYIKKGSRMLFDHFYD